MKPNSWIVMIVSVCAGVAGAIMWMALHAGPTVADATPAVAPAPLPQAPLGVRDLMQDVSRYIDLPEVRVAGIVSGVDPARQAFAMIDVSELAECGTTTCAKLTLPVSWPAKLAASVGQQVEVIGRIERQTGGLVFAANHVAVAAATPGGG